VTISAQLQEAFAQRQYTIFRPHNGKLYHDTKEFSHLVGLLKTRLFRNGAHLHAWGWTPHAGGGIVFDAKRLRKKRIYPSWYLKKGGDYEKARAELTADSVYPDPGVVDVMHSNYPREREWQNLPGEKLKFSDADIVAVWVGSERLSGKSKAEMEAEVRRLVPKGVKVYPERPSR
jgi:hypothetical protein